jgi:hypothetical protein
MRVDRRRASRWEPYCTFDKLGETQGISRDIERVLQQK